MRRRSLLALLALAAMLALVAAGCGGSGSDAASGDGGSANTVCDDVTVPEAEERARDAPTEELPAGATPALTFSTNCGDFTITLDPAKAPETVASLVSLAESGYYDDTIVHRIVPDFVIQGGDPTQTGGGGPGYSTVDAPPKDATYTKGVVAMAKTQDEARGTSGSQWFVVTADDAGLPADYAVVGTVTSGLDVVEKIGTLGDDTQQPTEPVVVSSVTVDGA
jgi:cyclophilin family peptidyl-prolyl cis-trans isomerase